MSTDVRIRILKKFPNLLHIQEQEASKLTATAVVGNVLLGFKSEGLTTEKRTGQKNLSSRLCLVHFVKLQKMWAHFYAADIWNQCFFSLLMQVCKGHSSSLPARNVCMYVCIEVALRGDAHGIGRSNWAQERDPSGSWVQYPNPAVPTVPHYRRWIILTH